MEDRALPAEGPARAVPDPAPAPNPVVAVINWLRKTPNNQGSLLNLRNKTLQMQSQDWHIYTKKSQTKLSYAVTLNQSVGSHPKRLSWRVSIRASMR
jgi:hypothetical protein